MKADSENNSGHFQHSRAPTSDQRARQPPQTDQNFMRPRAGSISSRLRAASDLEESGIIDKFQKGVFKDLIISGDTAVQSALEKYEKGDVSELRALITQGNIRRQSIDLLEGLDLDFLHVRRNSMMGSFDGDLFFDEYGGEEGVPGVDNMGAPRSHSFDMRLAPGDGRFPSQPLMDASQQGKRDPSAQDYQNMMRGGMAQSMYNPFQPPVQLGGEVDMSEYDAVAASLHSFQASGSGQDQMLYHGSGDPGYYFAAMMPPNLMMTRERVNSLAFPSDGRSRLNSLDSLGGADIARGRMDSVGSVPNSAGPVFSTGAGQSQAYMLPQMQSSVNLPQSAPVSHSAYINSMQMMADAQYSSKPMPTVQYPQHSLKSDHHPSMMMPFDQGGRGFVGAYSPEARRKRIEKFLEKRKRRVWTKKVKYDVRKNFADSRVRVKGRFVKKEDEEMLRELLDI